MEQNNKPSFSSQSTVLIEVDFLTFLNIVPRIIFVLPLVYVGVLKETFAEDDVARVVCESMALSSVLCL